MIKNEIEFVPFYKNNKLRIISKLNMTDMFTQLVEQLDKEQQVNEIELIVTTDDEYDELQGNSDASHLFNNKINIKIFNVFQERKKEKEKKEINKERKDKEKQKEVTPKKYIFLDENDETYVLSKKAQLVLSKIKEKRQKDEDVSKWTAKQFHEYLMKKYKDTYGHQNIEFGTVGGRKYGQSAKGIIYTVIKHKLMKVFNESGMSNQDLKIYIDYVYDIRSADIKWPITLNFLCNHSLIAEWIYDLNKDKKMSATGVKITAKVHKFNEK